MPTSILTKTELPKSWENLPSILCQEKTSYSTEEVINEAINAFYKGIEHQKKKDKEALTLKLKENLQLAQTCVENINELCVSHGIEIYKTYLRLNNLSNFEALVDINEKSYLSNAIDYLYIESAKIEKEKNSNDFHLSFMFMPHSEKLNEEVIACDGFNWYYEK